MAKNQKTSYNVVADEYAFFRGISSLKCGLSVACGDSKNSRFMIRLTIPAEWSETESGAQS